MQKGIYQERIITGTDAGRGGQDNMLRKIHSQGEDIPSSPYSVQSAHAPHSSHLKPCSLQQAGQFHFRKPRNGDPHLQMSGVRILTLRSPNSRAKAEPQSAKARYYRKTVHSKPTCLLAKPENRVGNASNLTSGKRSNTVNRERSIRTPSALPYLPSSLPTCVLQ